MLSLPARGAPPFTNDPNTEPPPPQQLNANLQTCPRRQTQGYQGTHGLHCRDVIEWTPVSRHSHDDQNEVDKTRTHVRIFKDGRMQQNVDASHVVQSQPWGN